MTLTKEMADHVINNNGTLDELTSKVYDTYNNILKGM